MQDDAGHDDGGPPPELSHAGAVVDQAIEYLVKNQIGSLAIASALLAGALGLMARTMPGDAILHVLDNAADSVRRGEVQRMDRPESA